MKQNNPPWSDKILTRHWAALEARVGAKWMPVGRTEHKDLAVVRRTIERVQAGQFAASAEELVRAQALEKRLSRKKTGLGFQEYGCGHYGCVMPTKTAGVVIKVTTDAAEAAFVAAYLSLKPSARPAGIVPYHRIIAIRSESHLKRPVFVLWRDEAQFVGKIDEWITSGARDFEKAYYRRSFHKIKVLVGNCLDAGRLVRQLTLKKPELVRLGQEFLEERRGEELLDPEMVYRGPLPTRSALKGPRGVATAMWAFQLSAGEMQSEPMGAYIGQALQESFDAGLLLADVHLNNIGMPTGPLADEIGMTPIVTDPGHAIALDDRYNGVRIEEL